MFRSYIIVALRNLWRHRGYSLINILGLAVGIASSVLILLSVVNELTYDRFHEKADRIYRVWIRGSMPATEMRHAVTSPPMAEAMLNDYPEVEQVVRLRQSGGWMVRSGDRVFHETENEFIFADSTFFDVFSFRLLRGDPKTCLVEPRSIVLTEEYATKYFGDEDPIGQSLKIEQDTNLSVITGVMENFPVNSHFHCKMIGSLTTLGNSRSTNWVNHNFHTYIVLREGADPKEFEERMQEMVVKYVGPLIVQFMGIDLDQFTSAGHSYGYRLQKLTDIHLHSHLQYELEPNGNPLYVYIFLVAAILILVVAGVNFMNLATARSTIRAREVGLRKVAGSKRVQLIFQFLTETVVLSLIALALAVMLVYLFLPQYDNLIRLPLEFNILGHGWIIPALILFALFIGVAAGSYPAFVLASFRPAAVFSSEKRGAVRKSILRSMLIVLQFTVAIVILVATIIVNRQLHYMQKKDPGFQKDNMLVISRSDVLRNQIDVFKEEISHHSNVLGVANSTHIPSMQFWDNAHWLEGWDRSEIFTLASCYVSYGFGETLGLELVEGRFHSKEMGTDSSGVVVNESAVKALGIEDPLHARFVEPGENGVDFFMPIIGVVKDFHFESMQKEISPVAIHFMRGNWEGVLMVRLGDGDRAETVSYIQDKWEQFNSEYPFEYTWMDEQFDKLFDTERQTSQILAIFSVLSIFITCLGLLGLISYTANQRTREIGIRKIMGASVQIVMRLLSREVVYLLGISALISIPVYFGAKAWLQRFAYHIHFQLGLFFLVLAAVTLLVLILSMATISYHSYRAASANPADVLRVE
jgi:putative ABC transport system permease protein